MRNRTMRWGMSHIGNICFLAVVMLAPFITPASLHAENNEPQIRLMIDCTVHMKYCIHLPASSKKKASNIIVTLSVGPVYGIPRHRFKNGWKMTTPGRFYSNVILHTRGEMGDPYELSVE